MEKQLPVPASGHEAVCQNTAWGTIHTTVKPFPHSIVGAETWLLEMSLSHEIRFGEERVPWHRGPTMSIPTLHNGCLMTSVQQLWPSLLTPLASPFGSFHYL